MQVRLTICVLTGLWSGLLVYAQPKTPWPVADSFMVYGIRHSKQLLVRQEYDSAAGLLQMVLVSDPDNIEARYLCLAVEQTRILDYGSFIHDAGAFHTMADTLSAYLAALLPRLHGRDSLRCLLFIANTLGGKSVMYAKQEKWLASASLAFRSIGLYKKIIAQDSTFAAAYLGTGVFDYYLGKNLCWIPVMGNKLKKGIRDVTFATRARFPYDLAAKNSLCWILIDRQELFRADSIARTVLTRYPDNTIFLRIKLETARRQDGCGTSVGLARRLANLSRRRSPVNWPDLYTAYYTLIQCAQDRQDHAALHQLVEEINATARQAPLAYRNELAHLVAGSISAKGPGR